MSYNIYESINDSLSSIVRNLSEQLLFEKRQQISPEDEKDNELLRSLLLKLSDMEYNSITDDERDAAARNGYSINEIRDRLEPAYGFVTQAKVKNPYHCSTGETRHIVNAKRYKRGEDGFKVRDENGKYIIEDDPYGKANVNLADLGRKRAERRLRFDNIENRPMFVRDAKKHRFDTDYDFGEYAYDNYDNFEVSMRNEIEDADKKKYKELLGYVGNKNYAQRQIDSEYQAAEDNREYYLQRIAELKKALAELDDNTQAKVNIRKDEIVDAKNNIEKLLAGERARIEYKRNLRKKNNQQQENKK